MRVPLSWLKEYIDLPQSPIQIAKMLTLAGLEVDAVETVSAFFTNVVVGRVVEVQKHPNADKLVVAKVTDGKETFQVVCGAPNCREGMKTAFAKIGAVLPDEGGKEFKVKLSKIRGVESSGMLCSGKELRISEESDGIMEFPADAIEGTNVADMFSDTVFEISLTPNLSHCACVIGVARELAAHTGAKMRYPEISVNEVEAKVEDAAKVTILDSVRCPRYSCRVIRDVKIGPSPDWLQKRLNACGVRPINNIVDITNYVLLEMGQPLHAFDFDKINGKQIVVRTAQEGEKFVTLDGKERILKADDLLISDMSKGIAIAGVMGGLDSEVTDQTRHVLLESAFFFPSAIRKTSKRLGLITDASHRFERGVDPNGVIEAANRAASLMATLAGGQVALGIIDQKEKEFQPKKVSFRLSRTNNVLGTHLSVGEVESILNRLEMPYEFDGHDTFKVTVPTYRFDIFGEIDMIEEVARIYGYENIDKKIPYYSSSTLLNTPIFGFEREIRTRLIGEGLQEFLTCDLIGPKMLEVIKGEGDLLEEGMIQILNPTSVEQSILRTSLLPGLLQVVKYNYDHQNHNLRGFEVGRIHYKQDDQYREEYVAAIVLTGQNRPHSWKHKPHESDFFDLKGIVENILVELGIDNYSFRNNHLPIMHTGRQASIYVGENEIGTLGEVHPSIQRRLDVPQRILFAEMDLQSLHKLRKPVQRMTPLPIYPSSERDWTIKLKETTQIDQVFNAIHSIPTTLLEDVALLDVYRSDKLGNEFKNVTFHFVYRDKDKTIAQEAVDAEHARITTDSLKLIHELQRGPT